MGSSTHAGAVRSRKADKHRTEGGACSRIAASRRHEGAATDPEIDILDTLHEEHRQIQGLLDEMLSATGVTIRSTLFRQFKTELIKHAHAEEEIVYARLMVTEDEGTRLYGYEGALEHELAETLIARASKARDKMSTEWTATIRVLRDVLNRHIVEEENRLFSELREHCEPDERRHMTAAFNAEKKKIRV